MRTQCLKGFTLLELMVAIAVFAVLLAVGVPSFIQIIRNNRITAQANELISALNVARIESIKRGIPVSVCSSTNAAACAADTNWATGWILFTDAAGTAGQVDGGDVLVQVWPAVAGGLQLNSSRAFIQYTSTGMTSPVAAADFDLFKTGAPADTARCIAISTTGRVSSAKLPCP